MHLDGPHRRYNPLLDEWVLVSPHRLGRPWQGQVDELAVEVSEPYDPTCYLCPGNARAGGIRNPDYPHTFVFDNDFPALVAHGSAEALETGLLRAVPERGVCRVVCFSPRHDLTLARMATDDIARVVDCWAEEVAALSRRPDIGYVQVFENRGEMMGCSNPHPHGQIWATEHVPGIPARKLAQQARYFSAHGHDLLGEYLARELLDGARIVCANDDFVALVPFWAVWPFETMVVPRRMVSDLAALDDAQRAALADLMRRLGVRYDNLFRTAFPYSMGWHGAPVDGGDHPYARLHATYLPPLLRSATIRKFLVGYELTAEPQRDLTAEAAAARLRDMSERHYRDET